jgi:eukaryotic-like serine/threonine-protein kinase
MEKASPTQVRFGAFELDLTTGRLSGDGGMIQLGEKPLRFLVTLLEQAGHLVTRETLQEKLWPNDTVVDFEHGINTAIKVLRRTLGDSVETPRYIETIPRKGYRLIVPVEWIKPTTEPNGAQELSFADDADSTGRSGLGRLIGRIVSHYRVLEIVGGGGMGLVYRGEDLALGRSVALKFLSEELGNDPQALERFHHEARAVSILDHPNICPIYEFGKHDGQPFFVMPLLQGRILRDRLSDAVERDQPIPLEELLNIGLEVLSGLQAAHEKGIIHRDIKPANIFLTEQGHARILDFGLAKVVTTSTVLNPAATEKSAPLPVKDFQLTNPGSALGTFAYMSPEQANGEELDVRTDLFSFGVVLYEMVTGSQAFHGETPGIILRAIVDDKPGASVPLNPGLPDELEQIVVKALKKDRNLRYQSAAEMRADLLRLKRNMEDKQRFAVAIGTDADSPPLMNRRKAVRVYAIVAIFACAILVSGYFFVRSKRVVPPSRSAWVPLTDFGDGATQPSLSPDGRMVAFVRGPETFVTPGQIYVKILPGGQPVQLTHDDLPKMAPAFSPDGSRIAYTAVDPKFGWNTWVVPVLGGEPKMLLPNAAALTWVDNTNVVFSEIKKGIHMGIVTAAESRAGEREVYLPAAAEAMAHRSWVSPDGKWVLVSEMAEGGDWRPCRLYPFAETSGGDTVGPKAARCTYAGWSPDGRTMYFSADAGDGYHIWRQRFPVGEPEQITFGATEEEGVAVSPDNQTLITSAGIRASTVWVRDSRGDRQVSGEGFATLPGLGFRGGHCGHSVFGLDGKRLFYLVRAQGSHAMNFGELWSTDLESGESEAMLPQILMSEFDISQDGQRVVFAAQDDHGSWRSWLAPLDRSSPPVQVTTSETSSPCFGPGGDLYFVMRENGQQFLYRLGAMNRELRKIYSEPVEGFWGVSPRGDWLLLSDAQVMARRATGGAATRLCAFCSVGWGTGGKLFYLRFRNVGALGGGRTVAIGLPEGQELPPFGTLGLNSVEELGRLNIIASIDMKDIAIFAPGPDPGKFAYVRTTIQRNLFRIPLN